MIRGNGFWALCFVVPGLGLTAVPSLAELPAAVDSPNSGTIRVSRDSVCPGEISPLQYGQFVEYLCNLIPSMWAEKLHDGSFEGLSPYKVAYLLEKDNREKPWYPSGSTNRAEYSKDPVNPVSGKVSQKIAVLGHSRATVGISQDDIAVEKGKTCKLSIFLRTHSFQGRVQVRLHEDGEVLASCELDPRSSWNKHVAELTPSRSSAQATLSISFQGPGTLWLDSASLMPLDNVGGWRADVVAATEALRPGIIRFGGSALDDLNLGDFEWRDTLGNPDRRNPFRAWGGLQPAGAGLEELVQFMKRVGAEPLICVRFSKRTPQDAADEVEYFNGSIETAMGKLRAKNGHPEPYRIKYWQVGNELAGPAYEAKVADFCEAMKKADPSIKLFSSYPREGVIRKAGQYLDYICPHHYDCADLVGVEKDIARIRDLLKKLGHDNHIKIAVTEWNTTGGDWGTKRARLLTLENALACSRYHNLLHRHADIVEIANRSNLINSFCSGIIQTDNHRIYLAPTYYAQQLYATKAGNRPLKVTTDGAKESGPDISATLSADGNTLTLFLVNPGLEALNRTLNVADLCSRGEVKIWTLADEKAAGEPDVANSFAEPNRVRPRESSVALRGGQLEFHFQPLSLTVMQLAVDRKK